MDVFVLIKVVASSGFKGSEPMVVRICVLRTALKCRPLDSKYLINHNSKI